MPYVYDEVTEFKLKEKLFSLSGDAFDIKRESTGETAFQVAGSLLSLRDTKTMCDADGTDLYKMSEALISLRDRMYIQHIPSGETAVTLRKKSLLNISLFGGRAIHVWKGGEPDGDPWLEIRGHLLSKDFTIKDLTADCEAAVISRKLFSLSSILFDNDTYVVRVNPGYDTSLMVCIAIAIDEQYREEEEEGEEE